MKLVALLSAFLVTAIIMAAPVRAQLVPTETYQKCITDTQQSPECCKARNIQKASGVSQEDCGQQFDIVKTIIPIIGIVLLVGGIVGAVVWERRRLS